MKNSKDNLSRFPLTFLDASYEELDYIISHFFKLCQVFYPIDFLKDSWYH